jgi:hypothetical protein
LDTPSYVYRYNYHFTYFNLYVLRDETVREGKGREGKGRDSEGNGNNHSPNLMCCSFFVNAIFAIHQEV